MKFLILSVTTGEGHNSTAKALKNELEKRGAECVVLDTLDYISPEIGKIISKGYLLITEKAKGAFRIGYNIAEMRQSPKYVNPINDFMSDKLAQFINSDDYDAVIFTHCFAGMFLDVMKRMEMISCKTVGILTDFTFHPYWEDCTRNDYVVVPDLLLLPQARKKGFRDEQILPFGIPINQKFSVKTDKVVARRKLGIKEHLPTFLIMGGSMGYGNISETVHRIDTADIDRDFQLIAVCGNNKEMYDEVHELSKTSKHTVLVTGFVDYIPLIMSASDFIITKPGGLTTSESLACGLPMIIVNPIPGQEERNTEFLLNNGCAVATSKTCPIEECIFQLLSSPWRVESMNNCISRIGKANSTKSICEFLVDLYHTPEV